MSGSGVSKIVMSQPKASNDSLKGNYNKKVEAMVRKNVHNQRTSSKGKK